MTRKRLMLASGFIIFPLCAHVSAGLGDSVEQYVSLYPGESGYSGLLSTIPRVVPRDARAGLTLKFHSESDWLEVEFKNNHAVSVEYEGGSTLLTEDDIRSKLATECGEQEWEITSYRSETEYNSPDKRYHAFTRNIGRRLIIQDAKALRRDDKKSVQNTAQESKLIGRWSDGTAEGEFSANGRLHITVHGQKTSGRWEIYDGILLMVTKTIGQEEILELKDDEFRTKDLAGPKAGEVNTYRRIKE